MTSPVCTVKRKKHPTVSGSVMLPSCVVDDTSDIDTQDYTTSLDDCQYSESLEIQNRFSPHKKLSEHLSESYVRLNYDRRADRVLSCSSYLLFGHDISDGVLDPKGKLTEANFCRDRLCPQCQWRRSLKTFSQVSRIMEHLRPLHYDYLFLTLTVPNVSGADLSSTLDALNKGFDRLMKRKSFKSVSLGYMRNIEVTVNTNNNPLISFHPHIHAVIAVQPFYFTHSGYITHDKLLSEWRHVMKDDSILMVRIQKVGSKSISSDSSSDPGLICDKMIAEISKYSTKGLEIIRPRDPRLTDLILSDLVPALEGRRFLSFGGCFKEARALLQLDDIEDGDLLHIDEDVNLDVIRLMVRYGWMDGQYQIVDQYIKVFEKGVD